MDSSGTLVEDRKIFTFVKGLNTEAKHTSFPENTARELVNVDLTIAGSVVRRLGLVLDASYSPEYARLVSGLLPFSYSESLFASSLDLEEMLIILPPDPGELDVVLSLVSGELRELVINYSSEDDLLEVEGLSLVSGELRNLVVNHSVYDDPLIENEGLSLVSGSLDDIIINYESYDAETVENLGLSLISGSLT